MKSFVSLLFLMGAFSTGLYAQDTGNVLKGDLKVHDPVMIKQKGTYYIFSTGKGVPIKTSKDKITWQNSGNVFASPLTWFKQDIPNQDGALWAPDIHYRNGQFHLYYSVSGWMNFNSSIGYATNATLDQSSPLYKWIDHGQIISYKNGGEKVNVIDPNIVVEKNGTVWMLYGSYQGGLRLVELDAKTGKLKSDKPELTTITTSLGEGSYIIRGAGYYYIFASRGICCKGIQSNYQVVMGRSKNIRGPYLTKKGESWVNNKYTLFLEGNYAEPGRGHNGFFTEKDTTFIVYHAYTRSAGGTSMLNIKPVYVDADGWPTINVTKKLFKLNGDKKAQVIGK
ncbi:arabinan endo-1,5-alpha-L-arabinosidase [Mucilaginibacter terrae]|uniref:arabinan endo-1,5-alpha-L-arabinosidase n=1 Tax=Mucilaginibacter terrae TaxID=1955052 RepID=UPI00362BD79B